MLKTGDAGIGTGLDAPGPQPALFDPCRPILGLPGKPSKVAATCRQNQRIRRSQILATIRSLLTEHGFQGVTVRRIAESSGHAVQTIYNLVGPRDEAIVEAISEYTRYVGRTATPQPEDPYAVVEVIERWLQSIAAAPEFCRQVSLIFFTEQRSIFYRFRDRELKSMHSLLSRQQKCGVVKADANIQDLAEQLVLLASGLCLEWSDRPFPLEQMRRRLCSGYANLLAGAIAPAGDRLRLVAQAQ